MGRKLTVLKPPDDDVAGVVPTCAIRKNPLEALCAR